MTTGAGGPKPLVSEHRSERLPAGVVEQRIPALRVVAADLLRGREVLASLRKHPFGVLTAGGDPLKPPIREHPFDVGPTLVPPHVAVDPRDPRCSSTSGRSRTDPRNGSPGSGRGQRAGRTRGMWTGRP